MAESSQLTIAVLAAGKSRRFGKADKLRVPFRGKALGLHATDVLAAVPAMHRLVVTSRLHHLCATGWKDAGFTLVKNPNANEGMGTSVAVAARIARRSGSNALMVALADMPLVPLAHYRALAGAAQALDEAALVASCNSATHMPPAVFGSAHFDTLADLTGDQGARSLLQSALVIECMPEWLADIDTPGALAQLS